MTCNQIIQYTTPTIRITFPTIDTSLISEAYLSFKVGPTTLLALDSYTTEVGLISFTLTQGRPGPSLWGLKSPWYATGSSPMERGEGARRLRAGSHRQEKAR